MVLVVRLQSLVAAIVAVLLLDSVPLTAARLRRERERNLNPEGDEDLNVVLINVEAVQAAADADAELGTELEEVPEAKTQAEAEVEAQAEATLAEAEATELELQAEAEEAEIVGDYEAVVGEEHDESVEYVDTEVNDEAFDFLAIQQAEEQLQLEQATREYEEAMIQLQFLEDQAMYEQELLAKAHAMAEEKGMVITHEAQEAAREANEMADSVIMEARAEEVEQELHQNDMLEQQEILQTELLKQQVLLQNDAVVQQELLQNELLEQANEYADERGRRLKQMQDLYAKGNTNTNSIK